MRSIARPSVFVVESYLPVLRSGGRRAALLSLIPFLLLLASCASVPQKQVLESRKVALLPFDNQSTDIEAAETVRKAVYRQMLARGYRVLELEAVDSALRELGVSEGGQLRRLEPARLAAATGGELLCYGDVQDFSFTSLVALTRRRVELQLKLVDPAAGGLLFEGSGESVNSTAGAEAAGNLALNVAGKLLKAVKGGVKETVSPGTGSSGDALDKIADVDLQQETDQAVGKVLDSLQAHLVRGR